MDSMLNKLQALDERYNELTELMALPEVAVDPARVHALAKERAGLEGAVSLYQRYRQVEAELRDAEAMLGERLDAEMEALVRQELAALRDKHEAVLGEIRLALLPRDASDDRDVIVEVRAGTGGEEAGLFAADLFRMYTRYAQSRGWQVEVIDSNESGVGGFREVVFEVKGKGAYSALKYESGVHRVQRVPVTEASGRIHTSTATVAVLPEAEEVEVSIDPAELKMDLFHSGGAGGQNVNKVETAVRITHLPSGMVVTCQDERSQLKNKMKAMAVLRARLLDVERRKQTEDVSQMRRSQVGAGERSEKIRTYNFPQDRLTDHRINLSLHGLDRILAGELGHLIEALATEFQAKQLAAQLA